jgi:predicted dehydrogenase
MTAYNLNNLLNHPILVIGAGSIGERHIRNLWKLGFRNILVYRQRNLPFRDIADANVQVILNWADVGNLKPYAIIIATPTSQHLSQAINAVKLGSHVLVEKPLSHNMAQTEELIELVKQHNVYFRLAYMQRFHPLIQSIKQYITDNTFGNLISLTAKWGDYLPAWHPWEDYRESYAAKKELGGGVALTLSHEIDLANWLINSTPQQYFTLNNYSSKLEMDVEAGCDVLIGYENGATANIHLNYYEKTPERYIKLVFDNASLSFEYFKNTLEIKHPDGKLEILRANHFDRNDLFIAQSSHFFHKTQHFAIKDSIEQIKESIAIIKICNHE